MRSGRVQKRVILQSAQAFFVVVEAHPEVWRGGPALHGGTEQLLHQMAQGHALLGGPPFEGINQGMLRWAPGEAVWRLGQDERRFGSLDALLIQTLGTPLPVPTVFAWIEGRALALDGWELVSLPSSNQPLVARRHYPAPSLELRLQLAP